MRVDKIRCGALNCLNEAEIDPDEDGDYDLPEGWYEVIIPETETYAETTEELCPRHPLPDIARDRLIDLGPVDDDDEEDEEECSVCSRTACECPEEDE